MWWTFEHASTACLLMCTTGVHADAFDNLTLESQIRTCSAFMQHSTTTTGTRGHEAGVYSDTFLADIRTILGDSCKRFDLKLLKKYAMRTIP